MPLVCRGVDSVGVWACTFLCERVIEPVSKSMWVLQPFVGTGDTKEPGVTVVFYWRLCKELVCLAQVEAVTPKRPAGKTPHPGSHCLCAGSVVCLCVCGSLCDPAVCAWHQLGETV